MSTAVPQPAFTSTGFVPPTESAVLAGCETDWNNAFQTSFDFGTSTDPTPEGQLCASETAIIGNANDSFCGLANSLDPARAAGVYQDAIANIYFLTRDPARPTVVQCACVGAAFVVIPAGSLVQDDADNIYVAVDGGTIPLSGTITLAFANQLTGPIPCSSGTVNTIYRSVNGWDTVSNPTDGVLGNVVESRSAFEARRQQAVAANSVGFVPSVEGALLGNVPGTGAPNVPGILDAFAVDNPNAYPVAQSPDAVIGGSISGTTLTVAGVLAGAVEIGQTVTGATGTNIAVAAGTAITGGSGSSWTVNNTQTVALTTLNLGGVVLGPNAFYVATAGGDEADIAQVIWTKKSPGCPYYAGNTTFTVYDTAAQQTPPGVPYPVTWEVAPSLPFAFVVNLASGPGVPSNYLALVQAAIVNAFAGGDGGQRARIGSTVYASRFYAPVALLGPWAEIVSLFIGTPERPAAQVTATIGAALTATGSGTNLTVSATSGYLSPLDILSGPGVPPNTTIVSQTSGTTGSAGVYVTSNATTSSADALTTLSAVMNVTAVASGAVAVGQLAFDDGGLVADGTQITALGTGSGSTGTYAIAMPQLVASTTVNLVAPAATRVNVPIDRAPAVTPLDVLVNLI